MMKGDPAWKLSAQDLAIALAALEKAAELELPRFEL
jgi:hypothetical protein